MYVAIIKLGKSKEDGRWTADGGRTDREKGSSAGIGGGFLFADADADADADAVGAAGAGAGAAASLLWLL